MSKELEALAQEFCNLAESEGHEHASVTWTTGTGTQHERSFYKDDGEGSCKMSVVAHLQECQCAELVEEGGESHAGVD